MTYTKCDGALDAPAGAFEMATGVGGRVPRAAVTVLAIPALAFAIAVPFFSGHGGSHDGFRSKRSAIAPASLLAGLPRPARPAFVPGTPTFLRAARDRSRWAVVRAAVRVRSRPSARARAIGRIGTRTPEGTSNIVLVLGARVDETGALWVRARVPALGDPSTGWIPRRALGGYTSVTTHLVVALHSLRATLFRNGRVVFRAEVGVGKPSSPTPRGEFYVRNTLTGYASPMYGPVAFGTSARSRVLTDWPAGGFIGIHGTDRPDLLPGHVSHGCIRMRNEDIVRLAKLMPVGTPLTIR